MDFSQLLPVLDGAVADYLCDDATWTGVAHVVRVQILEGDELMAVGQGRVFASGIVLEVRVSDVPNPEPLNEVQVGTRRFQLIRGADPQKRPDGTWWACEAREL